MHLQNTLPYIYTWLDFGILWVDTIFNTFQKMTGCLFCILYILDFDNIGHSIKIPFYWNN